VDVDQIGDRLHSHRAEVLRPLFHELALIVDHRDRDVVEGSLALADGLD
jgi:hypothetical protein